MQGGHFFLLWMMDWRGEGGFVDWWIRDCGMVGGGMRELKEAN